MNQKDINEVFEKLDIHSLNELPQIFPNNMAESKYELSFDNHSFLLKE